jgi:hypothetical protein
MVISNLRPQPVELTPGSNKWLFQPVYYVWADFNRTKDGSWPDGDAPKSIQYWYVNDASVLSKSWSPDDPVAEGWYSLNVSLQQPELHLMRSSLLLLHLLQLPTHTWSCMSMLTSLQDGSHGGALYAI